jgi:hypothetical protein
MLELRAKLHFAASNHETGYEITEHVKLTGNGSYLQILNLDRDTDYWGCDF